MLWSISCALCVVSACVSLTVAYDDDIEVEYGNSYDNEIIEEEPKNATPSPSPCSSGDLTKWDKMFSMLENSQMRENMLLQYADDIIKVEMGSLRAELLRMVAQNGGSCGVAVEMAGRRLSLMLEKRLRDTLERISLPGPSARGPSDREEALLQQVLSAARAQGSRLAKLESSCLGAGLGPASPSASDSKTGAQGLAGDGKGRLEQEVTPPREGMAALERTLAAVVTELQETRAQLQQVTRSTRQRYLPAGCESSLLFPMRSRRIYAAVLPGVPLSLSAFTACLWVKPTAADSAPNRTVLLSYGTRRNPYEIQLLFSGSSALFTVGGEAHLVEGRGVLKAGGPSEWLHLCGVWSSQQGHASLWADGRKVASAPGVAEGRVLPAGGSLQLGQERNGCCPGSPGGSGGAGGGAGGGGGMGNGSGMSGFEDGFDPRLAFAGKMTGVNVWDRVLSEGELASVASRDGHGCGPRGNVVAWAVTEMVPHGGAQFID
ncbi:pentraxin-related protein PTX3 [Gadus chalcogrammus]|uniref:pentraxin-related protein PTX3 n=1 Tax=Gadus chalcogrammus TaxID=1042646 RepID=UPI0024C4912B|nr:pentraxin-related protein PTX3 [Gadus chalcogrammus]